MSTDKSWMSADRRSDEYEAGVDNFIKFAVEHAKDKNKITCPCKKCLFSKALNASQLKTHLICDGINPTYTVWDRHGEKVRESTNEGGSPSFRRDDADIIEDDRLDVMVEAMEEDLRDCPKMFEALKSGSETPLYKGCTKFSRLSAVIKLYRLKAKFGWSDTSFTDLLALLKEMLPDDNVLPNRTYEAKRMLSSMGMKYERIHACPNDCILFRNEHALKEECPECHAPRYKKESSPAKAMWYFPIIPRFRRLFSNAEDAKLLTWHEEGEGRIKDGKLRHPADSPQWIKIDTDFPEFGCEPRNLRLALATDGMNPHGGQNTNHSTWPVILIIYNLPPELSMKRKYMMLSMLISGPQQPGNDIDVYLRPLIDDLNLLWESGVEVFDAYKEENFTLRAMLYGTINDFPAYGNLSGYTIRGHYACPICEENTSWIQLQYSGKPVYCEHRKLLPENHKYRHMSKAFDGHIEEGKAPSVLTGDEVYEKVKDIDVKFGKPFKDDLPTMGYKKCSIFFDLPYWKSLYVRHFLDVMHIEKNIFDSIIGTLLNIPGKTKDGIKARLDMVYLQIREELAPETRGKRTRLPPAAYTLSRKEKTAFCEFLAGIKVPEGYSSNVKNLVSMKDLKLVRLKSHDCHTIMQHFLPIGIRSILPPQVREAITNLCLFFKAICSKVIDPDQLRALRRQIILVLCEFEMFFPPSFFDIMVHLPVHLVREIQYCGPPYMRWMWPVERYMKVLKGYVKNRSRPEGCIVEGYIVEEAVEFCNDFLDDAESIGIPKGRHSGRTEGEGIVGEKLITMTHEQRYQAHLYVLHNTDDVKPFIEEHMQELKILNPRKSEKWIADEHNRSFVKWVQARIHQQMRSSPGSVSEKLWMLSFEPRINAFSYRGYVINGCTFYTREQDDRTTVQNSGVSLVAEAMHICSAKDKNPTFQGMSYYGVISDIWELDYGEFQVPVFKCLWVDNNGVRDREGPFTRVDLNRLSPTSEPFILASQAEQVFYVTDPSDKQWSVVVSGHKKMAYLHTSDGHDPNPNTKEKEVPLNLESIDVWDNEEEDGEFFMRNDHNEGIWIKPSNKRRPATLIRPTQKKQKTQVAGKKRKR